MGELGGTVAHLGAVVLATTVMYAAFLAVVRFFGQRSVAAFATFDLALVIAVGGVLARTTLLLAPTLLSGLVALLTLFALQWATGALRSRSRLEDLLSPPPVLLVADGQLVPGRLRRARLSEADLRQRIRLAGIGSLAEVGCAVLERNGAISIIRRGTPLTPEMLADVPDAGVAIAPTDPGDQRL